MRLWLGMSRPLRFQPSRSLVLVTQRTFQGRLLLRPCETLNQLIVGLLAKAQQRHPLVLHAAAFLSNHFHLLVSPEDAHHLADFMAYFTSRLAREVARLQGWEGTVFPIRYRTTLVSEEEPIQVATLRYVLAHGCKEGLVERPEDWPGVHCARALGTGQPLSGAWIDRTALCRAQRRARTKPKLEDHRHPASLRFEPLPCWSDLAPSRYQARVRELCDQIAELCARERQRRGVGVLGAAAVLEQNPHDPVPLAAPTPNPLVLAASRRAREALLQAYQCFVDAFRLAAELLKAGLREVCFPPGSFPPALPRPGS